MLNQATGESTPTIPPTEPTTPSTEPTATPTETPTEPATQPTESATEPVTEPDATITPSTQESTPAEITEPNGDSSGAWVIGIAIAVVALGGAAVGIILWKKKH